MTVTVTLFLYALYLYLYIVEKATSLPTHKKLFVQIVSSLLQCTY